MAQRDPGEEAFIEAAVDAFKNNEELQERLGAFVTSVLDTAEEIIDSGTPQQQVQLINKFMPHLVKSMSTREDNEEMNQLRGQVEQLKTQIRSFIGSQVPSAPIVVKEIPDDVPDVIAQIKGMNGVNGESPKVLNPIREPRTATPNPRHQN